MMSKKAKLLKILNIGIGNGTGTNKFTRAILLRNACRASQNKQSLVHGGSSIHVEVLSEAEDPIVKVSEWVTCPAKNCLEPEVLKGGCMGTVHDSGSNLASPDSNLRGSPRKRGPPQIDESDIPVKRHVFEKNTTQFHKYMIFSDKAKQLVSPSSADAEANDSEHGEIRVGESAGACDQKLDCELTDPIVVYAGYANSAEDGRESDATDVESTTSTNKSTAANSGLENTIMGTEADADSKTLDNSGPTGDSSSEDSVYIPGRAKEKIKSKRDVRNQQKWNNVTRKEACQKGLGYISAKGKRVEAKVMGGGCGLGCRFNCHMKITVEDRQRVKDAYYSLSQTRKYDYIQGNVKEEEPVSRRPGKSDRQRKLTRTYYLPATSGVVKVCRTMFMSTLCISEQVLKTASRKKSKSAASAASSDDRGKHSNHRKMSEEVRKSVLDHIEILPKVPSHFCRARSGREYFEPGLNVVQLWKLYVTYMKEKHPGKPVATSHQYRSVCNTCSYGFHKPKKDHQCHTCITFDNEPPADIQQQEARNMHLRRKDDAREKKLADKEQASSSPGVTFACYNLQKVMCLPKNPVGRLYYLRKVYVNNFTIWVDIMGKIFGICFVWHEGESHRGANEVASAILFFIMKMTSEYQTTKFIFWSDSCSGQNKNKYLFSMYTYAAAKLNVRIVHRYLEKGHTENEADSMHNVIETATKPRDVYHPDEWCEIIEKSREEKKRYVVVKLKGHIYDFHSLAQKHQDWKGKEIKWKQVREFCVDPSNPWEVKVKYDLTESGIAVNVLKNSSVGRLLNLQNYTLPQTSEHPLRLSEPKRNDLKTMIKENLIPPKYHSWYRSLCEGLPMGGEAKENADLDALEEMVDPDDE